MDYFIRLACYVEFYGVSGENLEDAEKHFKADDVFFTITRTKKCGVCKKYETEIKLTKGDFVALASELKYDTHRTNCILIEASFYYDNEFTDVENEQRMDIVLHLFACANEPEVLRWFVDIHKKYQQRELAKDKRLGYKNELDANHYEINKLADELKRYCGAFASRSVCFEDVIETATKIADIRKRNAELIDKTNTLDDAIGRLYMPLVSQLFFCDPK